MTETMTFSFLKGVFATTFYAGVQSYGKTCIAKILALPDNSKLKEAVIKNLPKRYQ